MSGADIRADVAAGLAEAGTETGTGPLVCTIKRNLPDEPADNAQPETPWDRPADPLALATFYPVTAVQTMRTVQDGNIGLVGQRRRVLLVDATGIAPIKSDTIAVGVAPDDVDGFTRFEEIASVETVAPGGVALMYNVGLVS